MSSESDTLLSVPQGKFQLQRLPPRKRELLRAWDAADEYLLHTLTEQSLLQPGMRILILNDSFGALAVALTEYAPHALSDSWLSHEATRHNLQANDRDTKSVTLLDSLTTPQGSFDLVLIKAPKTLALLEDEIIRISPALSEKSRIIVAGMIKGMPSSLWSLLERLLGPTTTSLTKKKAKLISVLPERLASMPPSPYPVCYPLETTGYRICNHANVFSRDSLDIGTRFFLQHLPQNLDNKDVVDLGCGNGIVGLSVAARYPDARVHFIDESYMALASARDNLQQNLATTTHAQFLAADALSDFDSACIDTILCNPPFHQGSAVGDQIAQRMFRQARTVLRPGGELRVIGNRHLGYHRVLKRLFGHVEHISANAKFVILSAYA